MKLKATVKTRERLLDEGFKSDYPYWYKGTKRDPEAKIRFHLVENLAGKTVEVVSVESCERGLIMIKHEGRLYPVETWMFNESIQFNQISKPKTIEIQGKLAKFHGLGFQFNCNHAELNVKDAVKLAKWVIQVTKNGKGTAK